MNPKAASFLFSRKSLMAVVSEYVRSLGLIPLVIRPLTPKLFFKQKLSNDVLDAHTIGKAYLLTTADGVALVILHSQSKTPDIFLPLSSITNIEHLTSFEAENTPNGLLKATALRIYLSDEVEGLISVTPIKGRSVAVLWSPDPNVGVTLEKYLGEIRDRRSEW